jgi:hypothetical protein
MGAGAAEPGGTMPPIDADLHREHHARIVALCRMLLGNAE